MNTNILDHNVEFEIIHGKVENVWWVQFSDSSALMMEFSQEEIEKSDELMAECYIDRRGIGLPKPSVFNSKEDALKFLDAIEASNEVDESDIVFSESVFFHEGCYKILNIS